MKSFQEFVITEADSDDSKPVPGAIGGANDGALKYVVKSDDTDKGAYALVSNKTGKALQYFKDKPSQQQADDALKRIETFKNK